jgi:hypothetical protein
VRIFFIFLIVLIAVTLKITASSAYYLSPDSHYYLQAAQNLLDGRGYHIDFQGQDTFCAIWPVGYSLLITGVSFITKLSVELSSKIVNLLAVAGILWLIHRQYKAQSWFVALALLSSSFLQLYANTWSETVFIFCLVGTLFSHQSWVMSHEQTKNPYIIFQRIVALLSYIIAAFLTRYIAFFLIIPLFIQRKYKTATIFAVVIGLYLLNNYAQTHTFTGNHGHWPTEPFIERLTRGLKGIGEETLFWGIRDWDLKNGSEAMNVFIYGLAAVQVGISVVVGWLLVLGRESWVRYKHHTSYIIYQTFFSYLMATIVLYLIDDSMESLYFRRLAPATFLALIVGLGWLVEPSQKVLFERVKWWIVAFFILSAVHALPKMFIFEACMSSYF